MAGDTQFLKGVLTMLLLRLLADAEDYGYALVVRLRDAGFDELGEGTVYPALTRLEAKGLLSSRLAPSGSGPARKYYRPTPAGALELSRATGAWDDLVARIGHVVGAADRPSTEPLEGAHP